MSESFKLGQLLERKGLAEIMTKVKIGERLREVQAIKLMKQRSKNKK